MHRTEDRAQVRARAWHGRRGLLGLATLALLSLLIPHSARGQSSPPPYTLDGTATYRLPSEAVGDTFSITVAPPLEYDPSRALPVLIATDADLAFGALVQIARLMQFRAEIPNLLIVGVGYGDLGTALGKRRRDLTPTDPGDEACRDGPGCGGANRFLVFLEHELLPFVAERYPVSGDRTFVGNSLGGLFGAFTLLYRPSLFRRYVLGSPTVTWDGGSLLEQPPASTAAPVPAVFVGVGGAEGAAVEGARSLVRMLESRDAADVAFSIFEGELHMSVQPMVVARGLRVVLQSLPPTGER